MDKTNQTSKSEKDISNKAEQAELKTFISRRHPEYDSLLGHWEFMKACYDGGREWFKTNIFHYLKEGQKEYADRVYRAYRFNHTREVVDLVNKYLFKMEIARNVDDASPAIKNFWASASRNHLSIDDFMRQISVLSSIYGRIWIVVDNNKTAETTTKQQEKEQNIRTYAYAVTPQNALDMSYDEEGELNWILIHEQGRDDDDPITSTGEFVDRFRLWDKSSWTLYTLKRNGKKSDKLASASQLVKSLVNASPDDDLSGTTKESNAPTRNLSEAEIKNLDGFDIEIDGPHTHGLGSVPVFNADNVISHELYASTAMIDDVAYLDRAVANYLSNLDAIIQDQTFSQLVMPAQGLVPGADGYDKILEMGTSRIFTYDAEHGGKPEFISPDPKQADLLLKVINKIVNEIYHTVGLAGERTKEDNALGIDNSSGVAKAYDFERVNSLLAAKADSLELIEHKLVNCVKRWNGEAEEDEFARLVEYPDNFDVRGLYDEFEIAVNLTKVSAPNTVRRKQMESLIDKLFPKLGKDLKKVMLDELKEWPQNLIPQELTTADVPASEPAESIAVKSEDDINAVEQNSAQ